MEQTAVEWLVEQYKLIGMLTTAQVNKAKEMEKQQIIDTFEDGREIEYQYHVNCDPVHYENVKTPEQYYNQTFKQ